MTIRQPRRNGDHGDLVSALVTALYSVSELSYLAKLRAAMKNSEVGPMLELQRRFEGRMPRF